MQPPPGGGFPQQPNMGIPPTHGYQSAPMMPPPVPPQQQYAPPRQVAIVCVCVCVYIVLLTRCKEGCVKKGVVIESVGSESTYMHLCACVCVCVCMARGRHFLDR